jgi:hypothetical protein
MNYARPQTIAEGTSSVTDCPQVPRNIFVINGALRNIGNVYRVKIRIDVGASTSQNSEARDFFTGQKILTRK